MKQEELRRLARLGALARLEQLRREQEAIVRAFPGLKSGVPAAGIGGTRRVAVGGVMDAPVSRKRTRRRMSAAERKAVSQRMKKYWAARRKAKAAR